ncbi:hypothetical protein L917_21677 [Phytophthora nicotianae]|uniref:Uncharacterized protein n=1 Tax=Phytophthora nicotianae TaxID=4792 RepID=W2JWU0_PHYNI|nr:hypothetical protein L917_21677 [Phytophthora nicotianae]
MEHKWVHPIIGKATDTACYRKSILAILVKCGNASTAVVNDIRMKVYKSAIVLNDIPTVTNNCMDSCWLENTDSSLDPRYAS